MCIGIQEEMASKNDEHVARSSVDIAIVSVSWVLFVSSLSLSLFTHEDAVIYAQLYTAVREGINYLLSHEPVKLVK